MKSMLRRVFLIIIPVLTFISSVLAQVNIRTLHLTTDRAEFGCCQFVDTSFLITCIQETTFEPSRKHRIIIYKTDLDYNLSESREISLSGDSVLIPRSVVKVGQQYVVGGHGGIYGEKDLGDYLFTFGFTLVLDEKLKVSAFYIYKPGIISPFNIYDSKLLLPEAGELIGLFEVRLIGKTIYADNSLNRFNMYCLFNDSLQPFDFVLDSNGYLGVGRWNNCRITNDLVETADGDYLGAYMSRLSWESGNPITKRLDNNFKSVSNKSGPVLESQKSYLHYHSRDQVIIASVMYGDADPFTFLGSEDGLQTAFIYRTDTAMGDLKYNATNPFYTSLETIFYYKLQMANHKGLVLDEAGNYYIAYQYGTDYPGQAWDDTLLIIKCNNNLKHVWTKKLTYPGHNIFLNELNVTAGGMVFLSGTDYAFSKNGSGAGLPDAFLIKLDSSGKVLLGANEVKLENPNMVVYPNPFMDELKIYCDEPVQELRLINNAGITRTLPERSRGIYNAQGITNGIYILEIKTAKGVYRRKLIKVE